MAIDMSYTGVSVEEFDPEDDTLRGKRCSTRCSFGKHGLQQLGKNWWTSMTDKRKFKGRIGIAINVLYHILPLVLIAGLITAIVRLIKAPLFANTGSVCQRNGDFQLGFETLNYNPWAASETFTINLASGPIPFATAKVADILWDVGVGRGLQSILAFVSYRIYTRALTHIMQSESVSYDTFEAITLQHGTVTAVVNLTKGVAKNGSLRARMILSWIIFSITLMLGFPTLSSAMTGYSATLDSYIQLNSVELIEAKNFQSVFYIIHDGARLGAPFHDDYPVVDARLGDPVIPDFCTFSDTVDDTDQDLPDIDFVRARQLYMPGCAAYAPKTVSNGGNENHTVWPDLSKSPECDLLWHLSEYVSQYGFLGLLNSSSSLNLSTQSILIDSPVLNISVYYSDRQNGECLDVESDTTFMQMLDWTSFPYGLTWQNTITNTTEDEYSFQSTSDPRFSTGDITYDLDEMNSRGRCQQKSSSIAGPISYQWGFSLQLLLACLILLLVWSMGMYMLHADTFVHIHSAMERRTMGLQRAVLDLAAEYNEQLEVRTQKFVDTDTDMIENDKLKELIGEKNTFSFRGVVTKSYGSSRRTNFQIWTRQGGLEPYLSPVWFKREPIRQWIDAERYWLLSLGLLILLFAFSWFIGVFLYVWCPHYAFIPVLGNLVTLGMTRRPKARGLTMAFFMSIFLSINIWWMHREYSNAHSDEWVWGYVDPETRSLQTDPNSFYR